MHTNLQSANKKEKRILHWKMGVCANGSIEAILYRTILYRTVHVDVASIGRDEKPRSSVNPPEQSTRQCTPATLGSVIGD